MTTASQTCSCASDDCRQNGCLIVRNRVMAETMPQEILVHHLTFTRDQLDAIRATDREAIAKAAQAWAEPRMGAQTARQLAEFIRGRV